MYRPQISIFCPQPEPLCLAGSHSQPTISPRQPSTPGTASSLGSWNVSRWDDGLRAKKQRVEWWSLLGQGLAELQPCPHHYGSEDVLAPLGKGLQATVF